ncbi:MAG: hypothetical protein IJR98_00910, partial [Synergistaceae bacterium]|nr:hypothetical protein [Synergistaceae bacterium]
MAVYTTIQLRRDSTLNWYASNPRLKIGEVGIDMTLLRFKIGNGLDKWRELPYVNDDIYRKLDATEARIADEVQILLNRINADREHSDAADALLDSKISVIRIRQDESEQRLASGLEDFRETAGSLEARLDSIAAGATEDTEILDARVDADNVIHQNLGHNVRNLHNLIKQQDEHIQDTAEELRGLLRQEISEEAQERTVNDLELAWQVNKNAEANIENSLAVSQEAQTRRKGLEKANERIDSLDVENEARKREIQSEARERAGQDNEIREQISDEQISRLQEIARLDNENEARK